jgi:hypothetical protein
MMSRLLRFEHRKAIALIGIDAHRDLRATFDASAFRRAWLIDGRLAGLGGVTGGLLEPTGQIWVALSELAMRYPKAIVREARRQIDEIMVVKRELMTPLLDGDEPAKRFAVFLGFVPKGFDAPVSRYGRRTVRQAMETIADLHYPYGNGSVVLAVHRQEAA